MSRQLPDGSWAQESIEGGESQSLFTGLSRVTDDSWTQCSIVIVLFRTP
jgi:hypothetical protein